jgi:rubrerythrin
MLDEVRDFHGQLAEYYHQLSESTDRQRVKLLLDHMSDHEKQLQESLRDYEEDASKQVMNTWVDCKYCNEVLATCEQIPIGPETSVDSIVQATLDIDSCLVRFYREVADKAESEKVRDVFQNLVDMEENELRKLALSALQVGDV